MSHHTCTPGLILLIFLLAGCGRGQIASQPRPITESELSAADFNTEEYAAIAENPFVAALAEPQSTFSIDVDTAAYANVRRMLQAGSLPPPGAVRIEELVNYFRYEYSEPEAKHPFSVTTELATCPWQPEHQLLRVGLKGKSIECQSRPSCNLVFLLDISGSMFDERKLPLVKSALQLLVAELRPQDRVAIVVYAGAAGLVMDSTSAGERSELLDALDRLTAGGSTNGGQGIELAYRIAQQNLIEDGINRVILCTDGDFNVGTSSDSALIKLIQAQAESHVSLTVLGFGIGNLKDSKMEMLADRGNGNYAYIDSLSEARKVLVEQSGGTLVTIAKDVKIQVDFNPRYVQSYRLLGYENRLLANQAFRDDSQDAGEIGAGHTVTAFYQLVPVGGQPQTNSQRTSEFVKPKLIALDNSNTLLTVNLRYKPPLSEVGCEFQVRQSSDAVALSPSHDFQFASAVVAYGMLLRDSQYAGSADWDWVINTAQKNIGDDRGGLRAEFVQLARTAQSLSKKVTR